MGQQLSIKSPEAYALADALSLLTGETLTAAVTTALRERLERQKKLRDRQSRIDRVRAITADMRANMAHPLPSSDHGWLYDETTGLPT